MKSADEWRDDMLCNEPPLEEVVEAIREEMRREWVKENIKWCDAHDALIDNALVDRMLAVGKPALKLGQVVTVSGRISHIAYSAELECERWRPIKRSELCDEHGVGLEACQDDGSVFLKAAMDG